MRAFPGETKRKRKTEDNNILTNLFTNNQSTGVVLTINVLQLKNKDQQERKETVYQTTCTCICNFKNSIFPVRGHKTYERAKKNNATCTLQLKKK